jgi:hypothetical protein
MEDENKKIIFHDENKHESGHILTDDQKEQDSCEPIEME